MGNRFRACRLGKRVSVKTPFSRPAGVLGRISYDEFKQLYFLNPQFGFDFLRLVSGRLFRNVEMAKANAAMGAASAQG